MPATLEEPRLSLKGQKLTEEQGKRLFAGEVVEFRGELVLRQDGVYALQSAKGRRVASVRVLVTRRSEGVPVAVIRLEGDPVRLLAKGGGYTEYSGRAMDSEEPEAIAEDCGSIRASGGWCCQRHIAQSVRVEAKAVRLERVTEARELLESVDAEDTSLDLHLLIRRLDATERKLAA